MAVDLWFNIIVMPWPLVSGRLVVNFGMIPYIEYTEGVFKFLNGFKQAPDRVELDSPWQ